MMDEIWITGAGAVSALGSSVAEHESAYLQKRSGLAFHDFFHGTAPDPCVCGLIDPEITGGSFDETATDRANRIVFHALQQTLESTALQPGTTADVILGNTLGNMHGGSLYYKAMHGGGTGDPALLKQFLPCAPLKDVTARFDLKGTHITVSSACGSSAAAIGQAVKRIRTGRSTRVIAGGFDVLSPYVVAGFNSLRLIAPGPCRPFDAAREGLNPGEAAVFFVIEPASAARDRGAKPLARIDGFGETLEAYHYTRANPEGDGVAAALHKAFTDASIAPGDVSHVHLHGTGTEANDTSEYMACRKFFGERLPRIPVCSTKSMTGHTYGGAAALGLLFTIFTLRSGIVPATLNCDSPDPKFTGLNISTDTRELPSVRYCASTALGFGGEAFAIVISAAEES